MTADSNHPPVARAAPRRVRLRAIAVLAFAVALLAGCGPTGTPSPAAADVRLYFTPAGVDPCGTVEPVVRRDVPAEPAAAVAALLAGPTEEETAAGFTSLFGPATAGALDGVTVVDGIAHASFADLRPLIPNASTSCGSASLLAALDATLGQFAGIRGARYSFGGDEAAFYEWLQMAPPD